MSQRYPDGVKINLTCQGCAWGTKRYVLLSHHGYGPCPKCGEELVRRFSAAEKRVRLAKDDLRRMGR